jgi:hypothetical protein
MAVALTLARLKLTLLRRSMTGSRGAWMVAGAVAGTGLAVSTIVLTALYRASPAILAGASVAVRMREGQRMIQHSPASVIRPDRQLTDTIVWRTLVL